MGTFANNLQILVGTAEARERVIAAIRKLAGEQRLIESDERDADRVYTLIPSGRWLTVIDEAFDDQDENTLERAAKNITSATALSCVSILLHDGDDLDLRLFERGKRVDAVRTFDGSRRATKPKKEWTALLPSGALPRFAKLWEEPLIGEEVLETIAPMFGWDAQHAFLSHAHLDAIAGAPLERLFFRDPSPPAHRRRVTGPPAFQRPHISTTVGFELLPGGALDAELAFTLTPSGGAGTGFDFILAGEAVALLDLERAEVTPCDERLHQTYFHAPFEDASTDGLRAAIARFADLAIPAAVPEMTGEGNALKWMDAQEKTRFFVRVHGTAAREGSGNLIVIVQPHENRAGRGQNATRLSVRTPRLPLTAVGDPREARVLDREFMLLAHVTLRGDRNDPPAMGAAAEAWREVLFTGLERPAWLISISASRMFTTASPGVLSSREWAAAVKKPRGEMVLTLFARDEGESAEDAVSHRAFEAASALGGIALFHFDRRDATQFVLWKSIRYATRDEIDASSEVLLRITSDLVAATNAVQAHVARWQSFTRDMTMYEVACGAGRRADDFRTLERATRTIRGVSEHLWLGPELQKRVDRSALERVATVTQQGNTWRVDLREGATLDDLERALEPILPR